METGSIKLGSPHKHSLKCPQLTHILTAARFSADSAAPPGPAAAGCVLMEQEPERVQLTQLLGGS